MFEKIEISRALAFLLRGKQERSEVSERINAFPTKLTAKFQFYSVLIKDSLNSHLLTPISMFKKICLFQITRCGKAASWSERAR